MNCRWCAKEVIRTYSDFFCSPQCALRMLETDQTNGKSSYNKKKFGMGSCSLCGKAYVRYYSDHSFCTVACYKQGSKKRRQMSRSSRFTILARDNFRCSYCGATVLADKVELVVDHVFPESLGGSSTAANLITACRRCNSEKYNIPLNAEQQDCYLAEIALRNKEMPLDPTTKIRFTEKT